MRFALAIIAALANAAGPWLCCCVMAVMVSKPAKADTPKSVAKCSHCKDEPTGDTKAPAKPAPAKQCPCQEHLIADPSTVQPITESAQAADSISHDFNMFVGAAEILPPPTAGPSQLVPGPFMTAETRLHVHHVLRC